jgi:hypothetical protein
LSWSARRVHDTNELLSGPAATELPVVPVCDCNSPADGSLTATYGNLIAAGFDDAWNVVFPGDPGLTCCHDEFLLEPVASFSARIDLVLFRGDFEVTGADLVGENPADRTPSGLWPSDHAGVAATLTFRIAGVSRRSGWVGCRGGRRRPDLSSPPEVALIVPSPKKLRRRAARRFRD